MSRKRNVKAFSTKHSIGTPFDYYETVYGANHRLNSFNVSERLIGSWNASRLYPVYVRSYRPGDVMEVSVKDLLRCSTLKNPIFDDLFITFDAFSVPNRVAVENIRWNSGNAPSDFGIQTNLWKLFMGEDAGEGINPLANRSFPPKMPRFSSDSDITFDKNSLWHRLGLPARTYTASRLTGQGYDPISAIPFYGVVDIWNHYYRDQNWQGYKRKRGTFDNTSKTAFYPLQNSVAPDHNDRFNQLYFEPNAEPMRVNKKHDYFTSTQPLSWKPIGNGVNPDAINLPNWMNSTNQLFIGSNISNISSTPSDIVQDLLYTNNLDFSITSDRRYTFPQFIRDIMAVNLYLEQDIRHGTRYDESIFAHFGIRARDYRLDYPEFLGSHHTKLDVCQVPQTSESSGVSPQGHLGAFGMCYSDGKLFNKTFAEHGYVIILMHVRCRHSYAQGMPKHFTEVNNRLDIYSPEFSNLTMQPVRRFEIFETGNTTADNNSIFNWSDSWQYNRSSYNKFCGDMLDLKTDWHFGNIWTGIPVSNSFFFMDNTLELLDRCLHVTSANQQQLFGSIVFDVIHRQNLPRDGQPKRADHF